ncbi:MAG: hypothetical protein EBX99_04655 [Acidimicrobiia bacterium]|nr:hypothetical protein [Acidimicrobiia bacterium]
MRLVHGRRRHRARRSTRLEHDHGPSGRHRTSLADRHPTRLSRPHVRVARRRTGASRRPDASKPRHVRSAGNRGQGWWRALDRLARVAGVARFSDDRGIERDGRHQPRSGRQGHDGAVHGSEFARGTGPQFERCVRGGRCVQSSRFSLFGGPGSFGHPGAGGSVAFALPESELSVAYVMNKMATNLANDVRAQVIADSAVACAGAASK